MTYRSGCLAVVLVAMSASLAIAQARQEITIVDASVSAENLTATQDGTVYFGSIGDGTIFRALPNAVHAEAWVHGHDAGLNNVLGVLADENSNTLWVCDNAPFRRRAEPNAAVKPSLRSFDLKTGLAKGTYPAPGGGTLNDVTIGADGTAYVSDTSGGRILRLKPQAKELDVWLSDQQLRGVDGLCLLADGSLYVNNFFNGKLSRVAIKADGTAGEIADIATSIPLRRPDGMRTSGKMSIVLAEGQGRLTEITINGDRGDVRVIKEGLSNASGVCLIGSTAFVLFERRKAAPISMALESNPHLP